VSAVPGAASAERGLTGSGVLVVDGVSKRFEGADREDRLVLDDVSVEVARGECLGVIGPNGAGKSTLLRVVAGVTPPTGGTVRRPRDLTSLIELGVAVSPELSGRENAELLATLWVPDRSEVAGVVAEGMRFADLGPAEDWPVWQYSNGMVARLVFGVATARVPELLLIDEVLSVGDIEFQQRCRTRLAELRRLGTTVVMVSHDMDLVASTCDRVVVLDDGVVTTDGESAAVIREYIGLPPEDVGTAGDGLTMRLLNELPVMAGDDLVVEVSTTRSGRLLVELVLDEHPALKATGHDAPVVVGAAGLDVGAHQVVRVSTTGLPPLRYSLHGALEADDRSVRAPACRVVLEGVMPELCASQLECEWEVESVPVSGVEP